MDAVTLSGESKFDGKMNLAKRLVVSLEFTFDDMTIRYNREWITMNGDMRMTVSGADTEVVMNLFMKEFPR